MRRVLPLLVLSAALVLIGGCAATASANPAAWHQPAGASLPATDPSTAGSPSGDPTPSASTPPASAPAAKPGTNTKPAPPPAASGLVGQLLAQVNSLRSQNGLPPLKLANGLNASAHKHNLEMAKPGCGLSHQCPGEPDLGTRIRAQGVNWHSAGENCGYSGPHANTQSEMLGAAKGLTMSMYNEKAPNDGHRRNLLSKGFTMIGIDVYRDDSGRVWLTQDFAS